jgi:hypothetical protein
LVNGEPRDWARQINALSEYSADWEIIGVSVNWIIRP